MAKEAEDQENEEGVEEKGKSSTVKIIIIAILATVLLGGGLVGATFYFVSGMQSAEADSSKKVKSEDGADSEEEGEDEEEEEEEEEPKGPAIYHSMDPKFVVSFRDQRVARFMQFSIEVMARDKAVMDLIDEHSPAIRSNLIMLFDSQNNATMSTREGKQQLLANVVSDINETLKTMTGKDELEAVVESAYFTSFVIQ